MKNTRVYGNKTFEYDFFVLQNHPINQNIVLVGQCPDWLLFRVFHKLVLKCFMNVSPGLLIIRK
jgi:hypothetical protein